jgi:hypothetical protein
VLPPLNKLLDVSLARLRELKDTSPEDMDEVFLTIQALTLLLMLKVTEDSHYFSREEIYPAQATFPLHFFVVFIL